MTGLLWAIVLMVKLGMFLIAVMAPILLIAQGQREKRMEDMQT